MQPKTWDFETQTWLVSSSSKQITSTETLKTLEKLITSHTGNMITLITDIISQIRHCFNIPYTLNKET